MRIKVDSGQLKRAARAVVTLNSFAKEKKDEAKDKDTFPCLITAKGKKLVVESAIFGLYLRYELDADVIKEGKFSTIASPLKNLPDSETLEINRLKDNKIRIKLKNGGYTLSEHAQAEDMVVSGRVYNRKQLKGNIATLPFSVLKEAVNSVTFKPGLPTETLRLQIMLSKGKFEVSGTDTFGLARIQISDKRIKTDRPIQVTVKTGLLSLLSEEVLAEEDEEATVGVLMDQDKQPVALFVGTSKMQLWHPVLSGVATRDYGDIIKDYYKTNKVKTRFEAMCKELQSTINTVTALWSGENSSSVEFVVNRGAVSVQTSVTGQSSSALLLTEGKIAAKSEVSFNAPLHYLKAFISLVPGTLPLEVNVCGESVLHLTSQMEKHKRIEFVMSQESQGEEES